MANVYLCSAQRTPIGGFNGFFSSVGAVELAGNAIRAAFTEAKLDAVDEVLMGCVLPAGLGQAPARQATFAAGLGAEIPATTLNKMCGSGMKTTMMAYDQIALGHADVMIAGGMESMTNAPYLLSDSAQGRDWVTDRLGTICFWTGWKTPMTKDG